MSEFNKPLQQNITDRKRHEFVAEKIDELSFTDIDDISFFLYNAKVVHERKILVLCFLFFISTITTASLTTTATSNDNHSNLLNLITRQKQIIPGFLMYIVSKKMYQIAL